MWVIWTTDATWMLHKQHALLNYQHAADAARGGLAEGLIQKQDPEDALISRAW